MAFVTFTEFLFSQIFTPFGNRLKGMVFLRIVHETFILLCVTGFTGRRSHVDTVRLTPEKGIAVKNKGENYKKG